MTDLVNSQAGAPAVVDRSTLEAELLCLSSVRAMIIRLTCAALVMCVIGTAPLAAEPAQPPAGFSSASVVVNGASLHYVRGGSGPAVILVHGFPQDWTEY